MPMQRPTGDEYERRKQIAEDFKDKGGFKIRLTSYRNKASRLSLKQLDRLILDIAAGKNSYAALRQREPRLNSPTLIHYLDNQPAYPNFITGGLNFANPVKPGEAYFKIDPLPDNYVAPYSFKDSDTFSLAVDGENRRYRLRNERTQFYFSCVAAVAGVLSVIIALFSLAK